MCPEHLLVYLRMTHPLVAALVVVVLVRTALVLGREEDATPAVRPLAWSLAGLAIAQGVVGPATIALLHPVSLRLFHLLLADLLWVSLLFLASAVLEGAAEKEPARASAGIVPPDGARVPSP